jgi:hypothetical protein
VQIDTELTELAQQEEAERAQEAWACARACRRAVGAARPDTKRDAARHALNEAEVDFAAGANACGQRSALRRKPRLPSAAAASGSPRSSAGAKRWQRRRRIQQSLLAQLTSERAAIDWTPVEQSLQQQLAARGEAEQALAAARDRQEGLSNALRAADEERLTRRKSSSPRARRSRRCA